MLDWEETDQIKILNNKQIHTRIDPYTKKGSTLDVGVIYINLRQNLQDFKVDTKKEWTPYSMSKRGKSYTKRFLDHLGIKLSVKMEEEKKEKRRANKEIINFRNKEGWKLYKAETDKVADTITRIAQDVNLT